MTTLDPVNNHPASNSESPPAPDRQPDRADDPSIDLAQLPLAELTTRLHCTTEGLSQAEAAQRLTKYGYNELIEKETNPLLQFLSYF